MQIYYFTRTGRCKDLAEKLAKRENATSHFIDDGKDWSGPVNFVKGGGAAAKKQALSVNYTPVLENEQIVLIFPVWAGTFPPAVRTFLSENPNKDIIAIPTSLGTKLKEREHFVKIYDLVGKVIDLPEKISI